MEIKIHSVEIDKRFEEQKETVQKIKVK